MYKILILTDSIANPRSFPVGEKVDLNETYPYLIRNEFKNSIFYQLTFGNIETEKLCSQVIGYLSDWKPDFIIVHSGLNDCRPEAFSEFEKIIILKFLRFFPLIRKNLYNYKIIKRRQVLRVSKKNFKKTIKRFLSVFNKSKIFWLEIVANSDYEKIRPGVQKKIFEYNNIIKDILNDDLILIKKSLNDANGYNSDYVHWNKFGHQVVSELLLNKMRKHIKNDN
jgi:hypothetical protein